MPYSPEHKRDTHQKILESARRLFNRKGFSEVSIDEIMDNAGLTRGGRVLSAFQEQGRAICRGCSPVSLHRRAQALAVVPENPIRADSRDGGESGHHPV